MNVFLLAVAIVIVTDLSGIREYIKKHIYHHLRGTYDYPDSWDSPVIHLLGCSLCQTWWVGLLYLVLTGNLTIPAVAYLLVVSFLTTTIRDLLQLIKGLLDKAISKLSDIANV